MRISHAKLLESTLSTLEDEQALNTLRAEYWDQTIGTLELLRETGTELCFFSCRLFRLFAPSSELFVEENSEGRWKTWKEFNQEFEEYTQLRS
ncbi:MAG: hypothetical protein O3C40_15025 [Planctomycetota bacterium]|nr:hypothetical protein [Planctomycetota bacterium]